MESYFNDFIKNYKDRIDKIQIAFQSTERITAEAYALSDNIQGSFSELKSERYILNRQLSEILAKNASLRKKDYYGIMADILYELDEKEKDAGKKFKKFIEAQKDIAQLLKNSLLDLKDINSKDAKNKIPTIVKSLLWASIFN